MELWRSLLARLFALGCVGLGLIGLIAGYRGLEWKLGHVGYFTGGILLGVIALILMFDEYADFRQPPS